MKKKIKLRDLTEEQYENYREGHCDGLYCDDCIFRNMYCVGSDKACWIHHKDLYSDKFLDQEIEIEVHDILTKEEKEYLSNIIRPFRSRVICIMKCMIKFETKKDETYYYIQIRLKSRTKILCNKFINVPLPDNKKYKGMKFYKQYTLEELGLNNKITLTEFWNSKEKIAIYCNSKEEAKKLLMAFDKLGKKWCDGDSYLDDDCYRRDICYDNNCEHSYYGNYKAAKYKIYDFEDVDLEN